jgi:hypothetical protein
MHGRPFHAKEMESNPQGPEVKLALANLVRNSGMIGVGGGIHIPSYNRHLLPLIKRRKEENNPYFFLFADVIAQAVKNSQMFVGENPKERIGFVFASTKLWSDEAKKFYHMLKDDPETPEDVRCRVGAVAFDDMEEFIPLQAADHSAFESDLPPAFAHEIIRQFPFPSPGLRLRTAEPAKRSRPQPPSSL